MKSQDISVMQHKAFSTLAERENMFYMILPKAYPSLEQANEEKQHAFSDPLSPKSFYSREKKEDFLVTGGE